ncbi:contact-dependent growth inhibition system immunity protein [Nocardioides sp. 616]|uniref:contact-dependent growth inhibition system immunity protein n=1 Tax=Nocardioides sp. 616 TaxID=2268090 RepID=UPI000CE3044E|nr:contact-dependent growth inhibition system immunity protein [Nocardioides sp. 616]
MLEDRYPALWHFLGAYLHQDWRDQYSSPQEALLDLLDGDPEEAPALIDEIDDLTTSASTEELDDLIVELGSFYRPSRDGRDAREWLNELRGLTANAIRASSRGEGRERN